LLVSYPAVDLVVSDEGKKHFLYLVLR
jgi:hypothetical protein